jgi:hypothetical protein
VLLHLYGVVAADTTPPEVSGRQEEPLRLVGDDELAVVVSEVDDRPAGPKDLLAHAHVLEAFAAETAIVPMQFGIALPDDVAVHEQVLQAQGEELLALLGAFDGLHQVTVQAFHREEPALVEVLRRDPALRAQRDHLRSATTTTQAHQLQLGEAVADALQALALEDADVVLDRLEPLTRAIALKEASGTHEVLHAACLVERSGRQGFDEAVADIDQQLGDRLRLRYVGPQPPYSFLEPVRNGELAWG